MGIEVDEFFSDGPPIFTGKALDIRLPDIDVPTPDGKMMLKRLSIITFPHWVFDIFLNGTTFMLLGENLLPGMHFNVDGNAIPIVDVQKIDFHGVEVPQLNGLRPIGRPRLKNDIVFKYDIKMLIGENGVVTWEMKQLD